MSYPYTLDLAFSSEKATADSIGRISFGSGSGLPTTHEELQELEKEGRAVSVTITNGVVDLFRLSPEQLSSLPQNLAGIVVDETGSGVIPLDYQVTEESILIIGDVIPKGLTFLIFKHAVDNQ